MALNTVDDIFDGLVNAKQVLRLNKYFQAAFATAGSWISSWRAVGTPGPGADPPLYTAGSGYAVSAPIDGAPLINTPSISNRLAVATAASNTSNTSNTSCRIVVADRLWACSGIPFGQGTHPITTPGTLPARAGNGEGVEIWLETYANIGASTGTFTVTYLNTLGELKTSQSVTPQSSATAGQMLPIPLAQGDSGVSQIISVTKTNTWTSGSFGLTLLKRIIEIPIPGVPNANTTDWTRTGLPVVPPETAIMLVCQNQTTSRPLVDVSLTLIDK